MLKRIEMIVGSHNSPEICQGCDKVSASIMKGDRKYDVYSFSKVAKPIYLTLVRYNYNPIKGDTIEPEYYCKSCASSMLYEIIDRHINAPSDTHISYMPQQSSREWEALWNQSKAEKKII